MITDAQRIEALEEAVVAARGILAKPGDGGAERQWVLDNLALEAEEIVARRPELAELLADPQPDPVSPSGEPPMETPKQVADELFRRASGHGP